MNPLSQKQNVFFLTILLFLQIFLNTYPTSEKRDILLAPTVIIPLNNISLLKNMSISDPLSLFFRSTEQFKYLRSTEKSSEQSELTEQLEKQKQIDDCNWYEKKD